MISRMVRELAKTKEFQVAVQWLADPEPPRSIFDHKNFQFSDVKPTGIKPYFICFAKELTINHRHNKIIGKVVIQRTPYATKYGRRRFNFLMFILLLPTRFGMIQAFYSFRTL